MVQDFIELVGEWLEGMLGWLGDIFTGVTALFYTPAVGENPGGFTFLGILMLFGIAVGLIYFGINFVRGLIQK